MAIHSTVKTEVREVLLTASACPKFGQSCAAPVEHPFRVLKPSVNIVMNVWYFSCVIRLNVAFMFDACLSCCPEMISIVSMGMTTLWYVFLVSISKLLTICVFIGQTVVIILLKVPKVVVVLLLYLGFVAFFKNVSRSELRK